MQIRAFQLEDFESVVVLWQAALPAYQGRGVGTLLMRELERRFKDKGCTKVNLLIEPSNAQVQEFYKAHGYRADDLIFMEKWLDG